jgi:hypothetical protein
MAVQWGRYWIRVNGLAPTHGMSVNFARSPDAPVAWLSCEEYASFLASDDSAYMSGIIIPSRRRQAGL